MICRLQIFGSLFIQKRISQFGKDIYFSKNKLMIFVSLTFYMCSIYTLRHFYLNLYCLM